MYGPYAYSRDRTPYYRCRINTAKDARRNEKKESGKYYLTKRRRVLGAQKARIIDELNTLKEAS